MVIFICFSFSQSWDQLFWKDRSCRINEPHPHLPWQGSTHDGQQPVCLQNNIQERPGNRRCTVSSCLWAPCCWEVWQDQGSLKMISCEIFHNFEVTSVLEDWNWVFFLHHHYLFIYFKFREMKRFGVCFNRRAIVIIIKRSLFLGRWYCPQKHPTPSSSRNTLLQCTKWPSLKQRTTELHVPPFPTSTVASQTTKLLPPAEEKNLSLKLLHHIIISRNSAVSGKNTGDA